MEIIFYVLAKTVSILLGVASIAMLVRMLLPIFVDAEGNAIYALACMLSEPFIAPVRAIFMLFNIAQDSPIDWAFFFGYFVLWLLRTLLPSI